MKSLFPSKITAFILVAFSIDAQPPAEEYRLIFSDDFNTEEVDEHAWWKAGANGDCNTHGAGDCEEDMWYKPANVTQMSGLLHLTAKVDPTVCEGRFKQFSSGWVHTAAEFKYGYYEIRAKVPKDNGFWPAFWFWSGHNILSYQEIDVLEFCGCDCGEYKAGFFYETDNNDIGGDNIQHDESDINVGNNACDNFNIYGVEWTPSHIRFYLNGSLKSTYSNFSNHNPMSIILNLAVGGCFGGCGWTYCGDLTWDTESTCHVACGTTFPKTFEIDWFKGYQKENQAIYINGINELCIDEVFTFKAPNYPNATYIWTGTSGLNVSQSPWLSFEGGLWRTANITAIAPGPQTVTLTVSFPSGYVETKTFNISVHSGAPPPPTNIHFVLNEFNCCYDVFTPSIPGATYYIWTIDNYITYTTSSNYSYECLKWGKTVTISVASQNSCGRSISYSVTQILPRPDCWSPPNKLVIFPSPSSSYITLKLLNDDGEVFEVEGNVFIIDESGNTVLQKHIEKNLTEIEIAQIQNGIYHVIFQNEISNLTSTFLKNGGN